jgi:hypothetical protein
LNIRNADIHKAADFIGVGEDAQRYRRLVRSGSAPDVHNEPRIRDPDVPGRTLAVASAQNAAAEDLFIEISRSIDIGDGDKKRETLEQNAQTVKMVEVRVRRRRALAARRPWPFPER